MEIRKLNINELKPAIYNPRKDLKPSDPEYQKLKRSIDEFGYVEPITWNKRSGNVVSGHQRLKVLIAEGMTEIDCVVVDEPEDREKALNIALNKIRGDWDLPQLKDLLEDLDTGAFDMALTGFDTNEIEALMNQFHVEEVVEDDFDTDKALEDIKEPITKRGDVWVLGKHRLMCGDSTIITDVDKLMDGKKSDMVFTDPPYNVGFNGRSGKFDVIKNDDLTSKKFSEFIDGFLAIMNILNPMSYYICCNWKFYGIMQMKLKPKACIVWAKNVFGLGRGYRHQHEFIIFDGFINQDIKNESDLWEISKASNYMHPTQKPVTLPARAIKNSSKENSIVLDLFGGSGSTLMACEQTNRISHMMELDEKYCDVIIQRWETFTGQKAELVS